MGPIKRPKTPQKAGDYPPVRVGPNPFKKLETLGELQSSEPSLLTAQGINHPKTSASHEQNRLKCCAVCWIYTKKPLNESLKTEIQRLFEVEIDYSDPRVPLGVCANCQNGLYDFKRTSVNSRNLILHHKTFDHVLITPSTRSQQKCACIICETGKNPVKAGNFKKFSGADKKLHSIQEKKIQKSVPKIAPKDSCAGCLGTKGKGHPHTCNLTTLQANMEIIIEKNPKLGERLAAKVLGGKSPSPGGRVHLDLGAGRSKMKVAVGAPKGIFEKKQVSAQELHEFCLDHGLGIGAEQNMGAKMNKWFGSGSMETGYREELKEMSSLVSEKFHVAELEFKKSELLPDLIKLPIWAVNDLNEYVQFIHDNRDIDYSKTTVLLGCDKGQKFLKFTLQVIDNDELDQRLESDLNVKYKSTGVNKLHYFALCDQRVGESNFNIRVVFDHVKAHLIKYVLTGDLAMLLKYFGKQQASSKHPCYICPAPNDDFLNPDIPLNTFESAVNNYQCWQIYSGDRIDLMDFNNQEYPPVGVEYMSEEELKEPIILKAPPPPLHLLLGVNHATKALEEVWPEGLYEWARQTLQKFEKYFGGTLEGNQCSKLIDKYDVLETIANSNGRLDITPFIEFFKAFSKVKKATFGLRLDPNFEEIIDGFKDSLESLREMHDISITPKFHMICIDVKKYCQMTNESLKFNEQSLESSHKRFKKILLRFAGMDPDTDNPLWPLHVLRALEVFNSNAIFRDSL